MEQKTYHWIKKQFNDNKSFVNQFDTNKHFSKLVYMYANLWEYIRLFKNAGLQADKFKSSKPQASPSAQSDNNDFKAHKSSPKPCPKCNGTGIYQSNDDGAVYRGDCQMCNGQGFLKS